MISTKELWDDALRAAKDAGDGELQQRKAVDLLYYSVFLAVRRMIGARRSKSPYGEHQAVIEDLQRRGPVERLAGNRLDYLRVLRNKAKYDIGVNFKPQDFASARSHATNIVSMLPQLHE